MKSVFRKTYIMFIAFLIATCSFQSLGATEAKNLTLFSENLAESNSSESLDYETNESILNKSETEETSDLEFLFSCGYPVELLEKLTDSCLKNIILAIEGNEISEVTYTTDYALNDYVVVKTVSAEFKDTKANKIIGNSICIYWEWLNEKPLYRGEDFILVKWNKNVFCHEADSFYAEDYWKNEITDDWEVSDTYTALSEVYINRLGHWTDLKEFKNHVGGVMVFNLTAAAPIDADSDYDSKVYVEYSHRFELLKTTIFCVVIPVIVSVIVTIIVLRIRRQKRLQ